MKCTNGQAVPGHLSVSELAEMLKSSDMQTFTTGCEALRNMGTPDAYALLKQHLDTTDRYQFRYLLSVIFDFEESAELSAYFQNALQSNSSMFVNTVLIHLVRKNIWVSDEQILECFERNRGWINGYYYRILARIAKKPENTERMIRLFHAANSDSIKIAIAECLTEFAAKENYLDIYRLFADSPIGKLRREACRVACKFNRSDLLQKFAGDPDGHVRKYVKRAWNASHTE